MGGELRAHPLQPGRPAAGHSPIWKAVGAADPAPPNSVQTNHTIQNGTSVDRMYLCKPALSPTAGAEGSASDKGASGNGVVSVFWWVRSTGDSDEANMKIVQRDDPTGEFKIPVMTNLKAIGKNVELRYFKAQNTTPMASGSGLTAVVAPKRKAPPAVAPKAPQPKKLRRQAPS